MRGVCLYLKNGHSLGRVATSGYRHGRQKPKLQIKMVASPRNQFSDSAEGPSFGEISFSRNIQDFDLGVTQLLCLGLEAETVSTRHMRQGFDRLQ